MNTKWPDDAKWFALISLCTKIVQLWMYGNVRPSSIVFQQHYNIHTGPRRLKWTWRRRIVLSCHFGMHAKLWVRNDWRIEYFFRITILCPIMLPYMYTNSNYSQILARVAVFRCDVCGNNWLICQCNFQMQ